MGLRGRKRKSHESGQEKKMMKERIESIKFLICPPTSGSGKNNSGMI